MILMSYLKTICEFEFNGNIFKIDFKNNEIMNRKFNNPDVFKLEFENNKVINITNIEINK